MSDIFISYKREDIVLARALAGELTMLGWTVWWDHDIPAGQDYDEVIEHELSSTKCAIVLWSERSVNSRNVKDEANAALDRKVLIPVLIGKDTRPPLGFRMIQGVRWNENDEIGEDELEELLKNIKRLIGNPPKQNNKTPSQNTVESAAPALQGIQEAERTTPQQPVTVPPFKQQQQITPPVLKQGDPKLDSALSPAITKFSRITPGTTYAIIVGIGNYKDSRIPKLNYTQSDAKAFYDLLINPAHAGLKEENMRLLIDEEATLFNLKNIVTGWLFQNTSAESTVLIYFAGHGGLESDRTGTERDGIAKYILPWDANCDNFYASALSNTQLQEGLSSIQSRRVIFFMDSCYSAGLTGKGARDGGNINGFNERIADGNGRIVIASAKPNQRSWEDDSAGHGIFTYHLLEALSGKADHDNDGYVSLSEVFRYLQKNVPDSVRRLSQSTQEPLLTGDLANDFFVVANAHRLREKSAEFNMKRNLLGSIYNEGNISTEIYTQSLLVLNKADYELTGKEQKFRRNLDAFLNGGLAIETFLDNWEMILQISERPSAPPPERLAEEERPVVPPASKNKFCTNCGKLIRPSQAFCTGCGKKVNVN